MLSPRYFIYYATAALTLICLILGLLVDADFLWVVLVVGPLAALGTCDLVQTRRSVRRNYPILAHMRFLFEGCGDKEKALEAGCNDYDIKPIDFADQNPRFEPVAAAHNDLSVGKVSFAILVRKMPAIFDPVAK